MASEYSEGQTVTITETLTTADGCRIEAGTVGTLMTDRGDGDWLVYVPGKGSPRLSESQFE